MKHVVLNSQTGKFLKYRPTGHTANNKRPKLQLLECPSAEHAQKAAEHFTRYTGVAHFARTTET